MGCGSSSLKGDAPAGTVGGDSDPAPRPAKRVNTNFNTPDYDSNAKARRMTEYAPHETERQKSAISGTDPDDEPVPAVPKASDAHVNGEGDALKPYHTLDDNDKDTSYPHENPNAGGSKTTTTNGDTSLDPTSTTAKDTFAHDNDPSSHQDPSNSQTLGSSQTSGDPTKERKRSWLGGKYKSYSDAKSGKNRPAFTDEELKKYTGKTNEEMKEFIKEGKGVGGGQGASARDTPGPGTAWVSDGAGGGAGGGVAS